MAGQLPCSGRLDEGAEARQVFRQQVVATQIFPAYAARGVGRPKRLGGHQPEQIVDPCGRECFAAQLRVVLHPLRMPYIAFGFPSPVAVKGHFRQEADVFAGHFPFAAQQVDLRQPPQHPCAASPFGLRHCVHRVALRQGQVADVEMHVAQHLRDKERLVPRGHQAFRATLVEGEHRLRQLPLLRQRHVEVVQADVVPHLLAPEASHEGVPLPLASQVSHLVGHPVLDVQGVGQAVTGQPDRPEQAYGRQTGAPPAGAVVEAREQEARQQGARP